MKVYTQMDMKHKYKVKPIYKKKQQKKDDTFAKLLEKEMKK